MGPQGKRALGENRVQVVLFSSPHTCASHYSTVKNITSGSTKSRLFSSGLSSHSCSLVHVFPKGFCMRSVKCPVKVQMQLRFGSVTGSTQQKEIHKRANTWDKLILKRFISKIITHSHTFFFFFCYEFIPFLLVQCNIVYSENPCAWLSVHPMFFTHCYSATHSPGSKHAEAPTGHFISIQGTGLNSFTL